MKRKILIALAVLILIAAAVIVYLNNVFLPKGARAMIISGLERQTQKSVALGSVQLNIFKGMVLRDLCIYDGQNTLLKLKEASCSFLIWPIFKKAIIIPSARINSPEIFLERRADNTWNLQDLFAARGKLIQPGGFSFLIYSVDIDSAVIRLRDKTLSRPFDKSLEGVDLSLRLSLPASVKFDFHAKMPGTPAMNIEGAGVYKSPVSELTARIAVQNLASEEFAGYYENLGGSVLGGLINAVIDLKVKGQDKGWQFSGRAKIFDTKLSGLSQVGQIDNIAGEFVFDSSGINTDNLHAVIWGLPVSGRINLKDFTNPALNADIAIPLDLAVARDLLKDKFKVEFPGEIQGKGNLSLKIQAAKENFNPPSRNSLSVKAGMDSFKLNGQLEISGGRIKLEKLALPLGDIHGKLDFDLAGLRWRDLEFQYSDTAYQTSGTLTDFKAPDITLELSSKDMSLGTNFTLQGKRINLAKFAGRYLNSDFTLAGDISAEAMPALAVNLNGSLNLNLEDLKPALKKKGALLERIRPAGIVRADFNLSGDINDFKSCRLRAKCLSSAISAYGLKSGDFALDYGQAEGIAEISSLRLSLYGGSLAGTAKLNLNSENLPYWIELEAQGIKIEKLKMDTAAKDKDISGLISLQAKLNGFSDDLAKLSGAGKILVTQGRLWELNLFQGLGALVFARDYASIIFEEASCAFNVVDKTISTNNLRMKSSITELEGPVKIGFDGALDVALDVIILTEAIPLKGTVKDVTTAIIGQAGRFGVIKISGTLSDPKFKFMPAVADIIKSIKNIFFEQ